MKKHNKKTIAFMVLLLGLFLAMVIQLFPLMQDVIHSHGDEASLVTYVQSVGWRGVPALIGLSALQVVLPLIPAPMVGVLTGLSYGIYWGPLIFLSGIALGNIFVLISVRQLSGLFKSKKPPKPESDHKKVLSKEKLQRIKRPEIVAFFLFMIPFVSGLGPYLFAETKVPLGRYIIAVVAGSIPSTIMYVFLGDRISTGNYTTAIIIAGVVVAAILIMLPFRKKITAKIMHAGDA